MSDRYILEIDPDPKLVPTARMFAATVARQLGCPEENVLDLKIAVSEACANAVQAHQEHGVNRPIEVSVEESTPGLVYEVRDAGRGIEVEPEEPPEVFRRAVETGDDSAGMGLALIRSLFPSAEFSAAGDGTVVRFMLAR
jgi:anti-sigma regulatory factor (Ser/Thr protein kinase)